MVLNEVNFVMVTDRVRLNCRGGKFYIYLNIYVVKNLDAINHTMSNGND